MVILTNHAGARLKDGFGVRGAMQTDALWLCYVFCSNVYKQMISCSKPWRVTLIRKIGAVGSRREFHGDVGVGLIKMNRAEDDDNPCAQIRHQPPTLRVVPLNLQRRHMSNIKQPDILAH
jgi:hypothetical protein